jgi:alanyl-tRNA synthetase
LDVVDVQSYGGYVLHSCVLSHEDAASEEEAEEKKKQSGGIDAQRLAWGQFLRDVQEGRASLAEVQVAAEVDYARRGRIAPNHSMTHVLHWALQSIFTAQDSTAGAGAGAGAAAVAAAHHMPIEQRGSLVSDEKLRFDFSAPRALTTAEVARLEDQVNDVIRYVRIPPYCSAMEVCLTCVCIVRRGLAVHNDVVRLADAQQIAGLRAVFGEVYPDPVRVLSIGPAIDALLANPTDRAAWTPFSIEFCGGTHVKNTRDARAFAIIGRFSRCCCCCCCCCCY